MADSEFETDVKMIPINDELPGKIDALKADGWELIAGVQPVAIYHIVRKIVKEEPQSGDVQLRMAVDESKVGVLRANGTFEKGT
jgi:hypothetical protein